MRLVEFNDKIFHETKYQYLYHMTDAHGFAYCVDNNSLKAFRQKGISTTTNVDMNGVYGRDHLAFKFVLDAAPLVKNYGGYNYVDHYYEVGGGSRRKKAYKEDEIRIDTDNIEPLSDYVKAIVVMSPMFTRKAVQDLMYANSATKPFMDTPKSKAPLAVLMLYKAMTEWKKPIFILDEGKARHLTDDEKAFIMDAYKVAENGGNFNDGMDALVDKYVVRDHVNPMTGVGQVLDHTILKRQRSSRQIAELLNDYYAGRKYKDVTPEAVKKIWEKILTMLHVSHNMATVIMQRLEEEGLFHPTTAPVDWTGVIRGIINNDMEEVEHDIDWLAKQGKFKRDNYTKDEKFWKDASHVGTMM